MPAKKTKKTSRKRRTGKRASYPKGYKRVADKTLAAERKKRPGKFPISLVKRKTENACKRAKKTPGQLKLF